MGIPRVSLEQMKQASRRLLYTSAKYGSTSCSVLLPGSITIVILPLSQIGNEQSKYMQRRLVQICLMRYNRDILLMSYSVLSQQSVAISDRLPAVLLSKKGELGGHRWGVSRLPGWKLSSSEYIARFIGQAYHRYWDTTKQQHLHWDRRPWDSWGKHRTGNPRR